MKQPEHPKYFREQTVYETIVNNVTFVPRCSITYCNDNAYYRMFKRPFCSKHISTYALVVMFGLVPLIYLLLSFVFLVLSKVHVVFTLLCFSSCCLMFPLTVLITYLSIRKIDINPPRLMSPAEFFYMERR